MNFDALIRELDIGSNTATAAERARAAARECTAAKKGMELHYPKRVEAGTMDAGEAGVKIWRMEHAAIICNTVADALNQRVATEQNSLANLLDSPDARKTP